MGLFLIFYLICQAVQMCATFWLSDWSNKADEENDIPYLRNRRLLVYFGLGIAQGIYSGSPY